MRKFSGLHVGVAIVSLCLFSVAHAQGGNGTCIAINQDGADAGAKIAACEAQMPPNGGIIDATGFSGNQTIASLTIARGAVIRLGCGTYDVLSPINMTNLGHLSGARLEGCMSSSEGTSNTVGTVLKGDTGAGRAVIDATGTGSAYLEHFSIRAGSSTIGVLQARSTVSANVERNVMNDVHIELGSNPGANDGNGTIGIYNYGAESAHYNDLLVGADKPIVLTATNIYGVASIYANFYTGRTTMSSTNIQESALYSHSGSGLYLFGASSTRVRAGEIAGPTDPPTQGQYAIWADQAVVDTVIDTNAENYYRMLRVGGQFVSSKLLGTCGSCGQLSSEPVVYLDTTTGEARAGDLSNTVLSPYYAPLVRHNFLAAANTDGGANSTGWELHIPTLGGVYWTVPGWLNGMFFYDSAWSGDNTVRTNASAIVFDKNGEHHIGKPPIFTNGLIGATPDTTARTRQTARVTGNPLCTAAPNSTCTFIWQLPQPMPDANWGGQCSIENSTAPGIITGLSIGRGVDAVVVYFYNPTSSPNSLLQVYCEAWE